MAAALTIQEFLTSDLPEFDNGPNAMSADSNADESQTQATTTTTNRAPNDAKRKGTKKRLLEAGKSTQTWATDTLSEFEVGPQSRPWNLSSGFGDFEEDFLSKKGDISVPTQPPSGNVCTEPSTEQDVVMAWSLQVSVPIFYIMKDCALPMWEKLHDRVELEILNESYVKAPVAQTAPAGTNTKGEKKGFHGVRVDQIYAFKLREIFIFPPNNTRRVTRARGMPEVQLIRENASKDVYHSIESRNQYLKYGAIWTKDSSKSFQPLLPLEFKARGVLSGVKNGLEYLGGLSNSAFEPGNNLKQDSPEGFEARSLLQQTIRYCEHYDVDLVFATDYENSFIFYMPPELFEKRDPVDAKPNPNKKLLRKPKVLWEYVPRESARLAFSYCLWKRIHTLESKSGMTKLTPDAVRPNPTNV